MPNLSIRRNPVAKMVRKADRKFRKKIFEHRTRRFERLKRDHSFPECSAEWLIHREILYGGIQNEVPRKTVNPHDPRTELELQRGGMRGGDRRLFRGYAKFYSRCMKSFDRNRRLVVAEFGILRGTGLAIWCDLIPNARVIEFDIDIGHLTENEQNLVGM